MPGGDRTGPVGMGPMTGRAAGICAGYNMPGYANPVGGRGFFGRGRGFGGGGRGRRHWFYATGLPGWARTGYGWPGGYGPAPYVGEPIAQELDALKDEAKYLKDALDGIKKRIEEIESRKSGSE